jgi:hypothetical protein
MKETKEKEWIGIIKKKTANAPTQPAQAPTVDLCEEVQVVS